MTRAERQAAKEAALRDKLKQQEAARKQELAQTRKAIAQAQHAQRDEDRKARTRRQARVGKAVDAAGLFAWDDVTLLGVFQALTPLLDIPDPVAVLDALLSDVGEVTHG